jgi:hypothetical protein
LVTALLPPTTGISNLLSAGRSVRRAPAGGRWVNNWSLDNTIRPMRDPAGKT